MPAVNKQSPKKTPVTNKPGGVLKRIAPVALDEQGTKINVYGRSATGKTTFACTFPKPLLLIGAEDGTRSVHNVRGVDFVRVKETKEVFQLADHVVSNSRYKTVVLDAASSLQDLKLKELLGLDDVPLALYRAAGKGESWSLLSRQQYGQVAVEMKELLRCLLNLNRHVVIIAQEREFNTEVEGDLIMPYVASALTPSVTGWLNPSVDYICQTFIRRRTEPKKVKVGKQVTTRNVPTEGVEYCLRTAPHDVYTTKFRLPKGAKLPEEIVDPDYDKLASLVKGNVHKGGKS